MANQTIFKLKCDEHDYYLMTTETVNAFELILTNATQAWKGKVTQDELLARSKEADITDYAIESRNALTGGNTDNFEYDLKGAADGGGRVQLSWKKIIEKDSIKFQLGSASLEPCENSGLVISKAFDHLIETSGALRQQLAVLQLDHDRLAEERSVALKMLDGCTSLKEDTEKSLYAKFVVVLNEKKAKIRQLKAQLEEAQMGSAVAQSTVVSSSPVRRSSESAADAENTCRVSDVEEGKQLNEHARTNDVDYDTDEEHNSNYHQMADCRTVTSSTKNAEDARRSRTASGTHSPLSFMLEDPESNDDEDLPVVAKRGKTGPDGNHSKQTEVAKEKGAKEKGAKEKGDRFQRIPCMLSTTGTTNTATTSSDRQRQLEKTSGSTKKDAQKPSTTRSTDMDDLIGDMA